MIFSSVSAWEQFDSRICDIGRLFVAHLDDDNLGLSIWGFIQVNKHFIMSVRPFNHQFKGSILKLMCLDCLDNPNIPCVFAGDTKWIKNTHCWPSNNSKVKTIIFTFSKHFNSIIGVSIIVVNKYRTSLILDFKILDYGKCTQKSN